MTQLVFRYTDSIPNDSIPNDIKQNDIKTNDLYPMVTLSRMT